MVCHPHHHRHTDARRFARFHAAKRPCEQDVCAVALRQLCTWEGQNYVNLLFPRSGMPYREQNFCCPCASSPCAETAAHAKKLPTMQQAGCCSLDTVFWVMHPAECQGQHPLHKRLQRMGRNPSLRLRVGTRLSEQSHKGRKMSLQLPMSMQCMGYTLSCDCHLKLRLI